MIRDVQDSSWNKNMSRLSSNSCNVYFYLPQGINCHINMDCKWMFLVFIFAAITDDPKQFTLQAHIHAYDSTKSQCQFQ